MATVFLEASDQWKRSGVPLIPGYQQLKVRCVSLVGLPLWGHLSLLPPLPCPAGGRASLPHALLPPAEDLRSSPGKV